MKSIQMIYSIGAGIDLWHSVGYDDVGKRLTWKSASRFSRHVSAIEFEVCITE